jgi:hypothetical protein
VAVGGGSAYTRTTVRPSGALVRVCASAGADGGAARALVAAGYAAENIARTVDGIKRRAVRAGR